MLMALGSECRMNIEDEETGWLVTGCVWNCEYSTHSSIIAV